MHNERAGFAAHKFPKHLNYGEVSIMPNFLYGIIVQRLLWKERFSRARQRHCSRRIGEKESATPLRHMVQSRGEKV